MKELSLKEKFDKSVSNTDKVAVFECLRVAKEADIKIYPVGGIVRDILLAKPVKDIDITVEGNAVLFAEMLAEQANCSILKINPMLVTAKVKFPNGSVIDAASTREEKYSAPGLLPVVINIGCSLRQDIIRRDFTVNSLALKIDKNLEIIDYTGGMPDIEKKEIKILHDKSFIDDPSRIVRALKFSLRFGFSYEKNTEILMKNYLSSDINNDIPTERIKNEIKDLFATSDYKGFDKFIEQKLYRIFMPEISELPDGKTLRRVFLKLGIGKCKRTFLYFAALFAGKKIPSSFNFTKHEMLVINDFNVMLEKNFKIKTDYDVYRFFRGKNPLSIALYGAFGHFNEAEKYLKNLARIKTFINGEDLQKAGIAPGKIYSEIFDTILRAKINNGLKTKEEELLFLDRYLKSKN